MNEQEVVEVVEALKSLNTPSSSPQIAKAYERIYGRPISQGQTYRRLMCALSQEFVLQDENKRWAIGPILANGSVRSEPSVTNTSIESDTTVTPSVQNVSVKSKKVTIDRGAALQAANMYETVSKLLRTSHEDTKIIKSAKELADYYMEKCYGI